MSTFTVTHYNGAFFPTARDGARLGFGHHSAEAAEAAGPALLVAAEQLSKARIAELASAIAAHAEAIAANKVPHPGAAAALIRDNADTLSVWCVTHSLTFGD